MISTLEDLGGLASSVELTICEPRSTEGIRQSSAIALDNLDPINVVVSAMFVTRFVLDSVTSDLGWFSGVHARTEPDNGTRNPPIGQKQGSCRASDDQKR